MFPIVVENVQVQDLSTTSIDYLCTDNFFSNADPSISFFNFFFFMSNKVQNVFCTPVSNFIVEEIGDGCNMGLVVILLVYCRNSSIQMNPNQM